MQQVNLPDGDTVPALGLGTWRMGESASRRAAEVKAVRLAIDMGYRLIDTAEMYGDGGAEEVVGQAVAEALRAGDVRRDELFIVSKVYPHNASRSGTPLACERSLRRLALAQVDLYLLHWRGQHPLAETVAAFEALQSRSLVRHWGVSNFDLDDIVELQALERGRGCAANQVYYSLSERGIEFSLLPHLRASAMPAMAYCPIDQGALASHPALAALGLQKEATAAQVALAWVLARPGVIAIPKAVQEQHLRDNLRATQITLTEEDMDTLDRHFSPPRRKAALAMQ